MPPKLLRLLPVNKLFIKEFIKYNEERNDENLDRVLKLLKNPSLKTNYVDPTLGVPISDLIAHLPFDSLLNTVPAEPLFMIYANSEVPGSSNKMLYLFENGWLTDLNYQDPNNGETILHVLLKFNDVSLARQFLDQIDDGPGFLETVDNNGDTALHVVINQGSPELVSYLIQRGAPLDAQNNEGETALHNIVIKEPGDHKIKERIYEIVRTLLLAGADQFIKDATDKMPIDYLTSDNSTPEDVKIFNQKLKELFLARVPRRVMSPYPEAGAMRQYNGPKLKNKTQGGNRKTRQKKLKSRRRSRRGSRR